MVLACVNQESPMRIAVMGNQRFCVNVLSSQQRGIAETFAGLSRKGRPYEFASRSWREAATGSPVLVDALASFDCTLERAVPAGSHAIFIGRAIQIEKKPGAPLTYSNRTYGRPIPWGV
jgi:flavin reductase (DIM6/NTAB) family NADH-FMN oxidoreductase RutF